MTSVKGKIDRVVPWCVCHQPQSFLAFKPILQRANHCTNLNLKMKCTVAIILLASLMSPVLALPVASSDPSPVIDDRATSPTVVISPSNTVIGALSGTVESYNGIYYADNPTGSLRLRPPQKLSTNLGDAFDASGSAAACPQMLIATDTDESLFLEVAGFLLDSPPFQQATDQTEDCLTVSVSRPAGTTAGAGLPVLFWIFGGAFEARSHCLKSVQGLLLMFQQLGWTSMYDPSSILSQAIDQDQPFVFVAVNYRVAGFGFMPGKEILANGSANLGLLDQRLGLEWVRIFLVAQTPQTLVVLLRPVECVFPGAEGLCEVEVYLI